MPARSLRSSVVALMAASIVFWALPAAADGLGDAFAKGVVGGANTAIKNAMDRRKPAPSAPSTVAQAPPVSQQPVSQQQGLPTGLTYMADVSVAYPFGNIGTFGKGWLAGGTDLSVGYGFNPSTRIVASMYQLQHWPYGFNSGKAPVYLRGFQNPIGCADLSGGNACGPGNGENLNLRTKDTLGVFMLEKLVLLGGLLPVVITPTYVTRGSQIGASVNNNDVIPFSYRPPDGPVFTTLATRTTQAKSVAFTLPFLKSPKMFGTFTIAPTWLVHTSGINQGNSMQLYQILYLEYTPTTKTTVFFEPQSARDYLPTDRYPQHLFAYFLGVSQHLTKSTFVQIVLNSGGPTNEGALGITGITCETVTVCAPSIGGLKATQIQLQLGIGSPSVIPL